MGAIESASYNLFWPSIGCFFVAEYFNGPDCGNRLTDFFGSFTYFLAIALLVAQVVIMIIGMVKKGKNCISELLEPKNYLELLLLLVGISYIANIHPGYKDWCKEYKAFYWIHGILYFIAIGFGLYLWVGQKKDFMIPEIISVVIMSHGFDNCGRNGLAGGDGLLDDVKFYEAISTLAFFILFLVILTNLIDKKTDVVDLKTGLSYSIICIMTPSFYFGGVGLYGGFLLWGLLLGLIIADLVKCKFEPDKLILPVVALACIGYMYTNFGCAGKDYGRKVYGVLTLIGAYLGLVCAILLAVLYIIVLVKGKSSGK